MYRSVCVLLSMSHYCTHNPAHHQGHHTQVSTHQNSQYSSKELTASAEITACRHSFTAAQLQQYQYDTAVLELLSCSRDTTKSVNHIPLAGHENTCVRAVSPAVYRGCPSAERGATNAEQTPQQLASSSPRATGNTAAGIAAVGHLRRHLQGR